MKLLKNILILFSIGFFFWACSSTNINNTKNEKEKPVVIANDSLEYEVIIIDLGFNQYLNSIALPRKHYSQQYMENRNLFFVTEWNRRVQNPQNYNSNIYENIIDYKSSIDYGYEVNYLIFNYFLFAQRKYKMSLGFGRRNRVN